jgi:hypothetical protein
VESAPATAAADPARNVRREIAFMLGLRKNCCPDNTDLTSLPEEF